MRLISTTGLRRSAGFSLLEMVVAISILALALASLYQAASGATRNVRTDEKYAYAVELAQSVLANNAMVPVSGVDTHGETAGGFQWRVKTRPVSLQRTSLPMGSLQEIEVAVGWVDGRKWREVVLNSVVEGFKP
ncbi:MAG: general secretion pathway protein GspI [Gammaproteobacteria bacterium]|nr:MAG: general secretion pathway protein GspI [Gammaproteobacteria bacterium]RLA60211.1 MAG: general secretion pathway protein GspI [Gammaproteobacteria bacterium]